MKISSFGTFSLILGVSLLGSACKSKSAATKTEPTVIAAGSDTAPAAGSAVVAAAGSAAAPAAGSAAEPAPAKDGTLRIPRKKVTVGSICTKTSEQTVDGTVTTPNGDQKFSEKPSKTVREEVLAVEGDLATRSRVTFNGSETKILDGLTFEVWREGGELKAKLADGTDATPEQLALLNDESLVDGPAGMNVFVSSRDWTVGERYLLTATDLAAMKDSDAWGSLALTLKDSENATATFLVEGSRTNIDDGGSNFVIDVKGEVQVVESTGLPKLMNLSGTMKGVAKKMPIVGTMTVTQTMECEQAK